MAKSYLGMPVGYKRLDGSPLVDCELWMNSGEGDNLVTGYSQAAKYASGDVAQHPDAPTSYVGQYLAAQATDGTVSLYVVQPSRLLLRVGDFPNQEFTAASLQDGILIVANQKVPLGILNKTNGDYFAVAPTRMNESGFYVIDLSGLTIEGTWELVYN